MKVLWEHRWFALAVVAVLVVLVLGRYDLRPSPDRQFVFILDRLTGTVEIQLTSDMLGRLTAREPVTDPATLEQLKR